MEAGVINLERKKVIIIGAGIAGLSAASYLQRNGYDTEIFEAHSLPGGLCTSWKRVDYTFDYCISNPPFGIDWKGDQNAVKAEHELGENGRFRVGLPRISDGQLLFQLNGLSKLKETGRMAIIHNGSALFSGNPGAGESLIRQYG